MIDMGKSYLLLLKQLDKYKEERINIEKSRSKKETDIIEDNRLIQREVSTTSDIINDLNDRIKQQDIKINI